jgi:hypothetical protein
MGENATRQTIAPKVPLKRGKAKASAFSAKHSAAHVLITQSDSIQSEGNKTAIRAFDASDFTNSKSTRKSGV